MAYALITGAGSGLGRAAALKLAAAGYDVVVSDRDGRAAESVCAEIAAGGGTASPLVLDVADIAAGKAAAEALTRARGPLDAFVANAGISGHGRPFLDVDAAAFDAMMNVHVRGHFFLLQAFAPGMIAARRGAVVIVSSIYARVGVGSMPHYAAAKGALLSLTKALATELGQHGIRVNAVTPGLVETPMTRTSAAGRADFFSGRADVLPLRRLTTPDEVADTIAWLLSPAASSLTGQALSPSSGEVMAD